MPDPTTVSTPRPLSGGDSLFLDFDGTLVDLADRPDTVVVDTALHDLLIDVADHLDGRVAIVSGRSVAQIDSFLGPALARVAVVGSHGSEIRAAGGAIVRPDRPAALTEAERLFGERFGQNRGVVIEVKSLGVAIHYRLSPDVEAEAMAMVEAFAGREGLAVQNGKMMTELRIAGHDKGTAIGALCETPPFAGTTPIFAGDDLTDEPGFVVCARHGGGGILVGDPRETAATWRLDDVAAVRAWLGSAA